jgi:hypothetical protein
MPQKRGTKPHSAKSSRSPAATLGAILNRPDAEKRDVRTSRARAVADRLRQQEALWDAWHKRWPRRADDQLGEFAKRLKEWGDAVHACGPALHALRNWQTPDKLPPDERQLADFARHIARRVCHPRCTAAAISRDLQKARASAKGEELIATLYMPMGWLARIHADVDGAVHREINKALAPRKKKGNEAGSHEAARDRPAEQTAVGGGGAVAPPVQPTQPSASTAVPADLSILTDRQEEVAEVAGAGDPTAGETSRPTEHSEGGPFDLLLDLSEWAVRRGGVSASFAGKQYPWKVFKLLCKNYPTSSTTRAILDDVWGEGVRSKEALFHHITTIRKLIRPLGLKVFHTRGVGYKLGVG